MNSCSRQALPKSTMSRLGYFFPLFLLALLLIVPLTNFYFKYPFFEFHQGYFTVAIVSFFSAIIFSIIPPRIYLSSIHKYLLGLICLIIFHIFFFSSVYIEQLLLLIIIFIMLMIMVSATQSCMDFFGREAVLITILTGLVCGASLQSIVGILQFFQLDIYFHPFVYITQGSAVEGLIRQTNQMGNYLFTGLLATCFLIYLRKLSLSIGVILVLLIGFTLGLISSRSIIAYLIVTLLLCVIALVISRKEHFRAVKIIFFVLMFVLFLQIFLPNILDFFGVELFSALEKLNSEISNNRFYEWEKAWIVFKNNSIFGVGWNGFAAESFRLDIALKDHRPVSEGVLFTHSHNLFLQVLAESGLVGFLIVVGGFVWIALRYALKNLYSAKAMMTLSLFIPILAHSMLEYPLWYLTFLVIFFCMLTLLVNKSENQYALLQTKPLKIISIILPLMIFMGSIYHIVLYDKLSDIADPKIADNTEQRMEKSLQIEKIKKESFLFDFYTDYMLQLKLPFIETEKTKELSQSITKLSSAYPTLGLVLYSSLHAYNHGYHKFAIAELEKVVGYYSSKTPLILSFLETYPLFTPMRNIVYQECIKYFANQPQKCEI